VGASTNPAKTLTILLLAEEEVGDEIFIQNRQKTLLSQCKTSKSA